MQTCLSLLWFLLIVLCAPGVALYKPSSIRYIESTYRQYDKDLHGKVWRNKYDLLSKKGYKMAGVHGGVLDQPALNISTELGLLTMAAEPSLVKMDFHLSYNIPTPWPYCESLSKCIVYSQPGAPEPKSAIILKLPPSTQAIDFYVDAAIDCVETRRAAIKCKVTLEPGHVQVKAVLHSICDSPFVGKYFGFYDKHGDIDSVSISCNSAFPNALGLLRIGRRRHNADSLEDGGGAQDVLLMPDAS